jgi:DNA-binding MarR family transcriptional regulator
MTAWLSPTEQLAWRTYLEASSRFAERLDSDLRRRSGLALTDYEILAMLSEAPGRQLRMGDLADHVLVSRSRLTYRVDRLVERGFVERVTCPSDGRGFNAVLTDAGMEALEAAAPGHVDDVQRHLIGQLRPEELDMFIDVFSRVMTSLDT